MNPELFVLVQEALSGRERDRISFERVVVKMNEALASSSIRNAELKEIKFIAGGIVDRVWKHHIQEKYFFNRKFMELTEATQQVIDSMPFMSSLHDVLLAKKKLDKIEISDIVIEDMKKVVLELCPLAEAANFLKEHTIKGRQPRALPPETNPNKLIKTCPCCLRKIAVQGGNPQSTMVHHGYTRPGHGYQTNSCPGIRFKSLEVSPDGVKYMLGLTEGWLKQAYDKYDKRDRLVSIKELKSGSGVAYVETFPSDPNWNRVYARWLSNLENEIRFLEKDKQILSDRLIHWKPELANDDSDTSDPASGITP